jgi:hypothetical protein
MTSKVENFRYNGFFVESRRGFTKYKAIKLISWTNDPGIGEFLCSDNKKRLIPSCCLSKEFLDTQPKRPKLNPFKGTGVFFGMPAKS